jgi:hypothetical protein
MRQDMKAWLFRATEPVLLYGSETWTISQSDLVKCINGCYSRMLRMALNIHWKQIISNSDLFGNIPKPPVMIGNVLFSIAKQFFKRRDYEII